MTRTILAEFKTPRAYATAPGAVVLCHLSDNTYHPYVTWWRNDEAGGYSSGHYFATEEEARKDFIKRCERNY